MKLVWSTILVSIAALLSRFLGVWRDNLLASTFGAMQHSALQPLDAYYAAFRIPDFLYNVVIMSAGAAIFVPLFAREIKKNQEYANKMLNNFLHIAFFTLLIGSLLIVLTVPFFIDFFTIGFTPEGKQLTVRLIQIMLLSPLFFGLSSIVGSYLSVYKNFISYILSPLLYNLAIIASIIIFVPIFGIYGLAYGVVLGAFLHFAIQIFPLLKRKYHYLFSCTFFIPEVKEMGRLILPRIIGISAAQVNLVVDTVIASTLAAGSLTILNWTQNMQYVPIGLIGISLSITSFTLFSDFASVNDTKRFRSTFLKTVCMTIFLNLPLTVGFFFFRFDIVNLIFNYGKFSEMSNNMDITAQTLGLFIISMVFQSLIPIITRAFYAYQDTKTPVISVLWTVVLNIALSLLFVKVYSFGIMGLALSFSISNIFNALFLFFLINKKIAKGLISFKEFAPFVVKTMIASLVMGIILFIAYHLFAFLPVTKVMILVKDGVAIVLGGIGFFMASKVLKIKELDELMDRIPLPFRK